MHLLVLCAKISLCVNSEREGFNMYRINQWVKLCVAMVLSVMFLQSAVAASSDDVASSDASSSSMSYKEKVQQAVKDQTKQQVADRLKDVVAQCKKQTNQEACKQEYPFHLLHKQKSIDSISNCLAEQTLQCISTQLGSASSDEPASTSDS